MIAQYEPVESPRISNAKIYVLCGILALAIFVIDLQLPLGVAGGVPYVLVILVSLWSPKQRLVIILAVVCTFLVFLGYYFSPSGGELWKVISNRALAIFAILVTAFLALKWKLHEKEMLALESKIELEKEKVYLATIHGAQHITNNLLNELNLVQLEIESHPAFDKEILSLFGKMLDEANTLMKRLSSVGHIDDEAIRQSIYPRNNP